MSCREDVTLGTCRLLWADALDVLPALEANSLDACVCDPPYGLEFMGADFDKLGKGLAMQEWHHRWAVETIRVLKPGAFCVAFGGTRTYHRLMCALEDAGFELRDTLMYLYGSGFPKSLDVSKALDHEAGVEREVIGEGPFASRRPSSDHALQGLTFADDAYVRPAGHILTAPATEAARQWDGYGTNLKPAWEPIILARKPLQGTVVENVLKWGCGALNIDKCRIVTTDNTTTRHSSSSSFMTGRIGEVQPKQAPYTTGGTLGRWPANVLTDGSAEVVGLFPQSTAGQETTARGTGGIWTDISNTPCGPQYGDSGSAARFFYTAKASPSERGAGNTHPTVKPISLTRWLVRLVTPPGGTVLDPFAGSGTTGIACYEEHRACLLIERERDYFAIAHERLTAATTQLTLFAPPYPGAGGGELP